VCKGEGDVYEYECRVHRSEHLEENTLGHIKGELEKMSLLNINIVLEYQLVSATA